MKRKVGELFNKPIVQGNENVLSSNEILVEQKGNTFSLKERVNGEIKEVSGGSADTMEYFIAKDAPQLSPYLSTVKLSINSGAAINISPFTPNITSWVENDEILAFGVDFQARTVLVVGEQKMEGSLLDAMLPYLELSADQIAALPRITKEEFFTLPKDVTVKYKDQEKLKEVYEGIVDLYIRRGLPIYGKTREAADLEEPIVYFNYKSLGIGHNEFGAMISPTHLLMYGKGQQGYPKNDWDESFSDSEDVFYDYLEFNNCYIFKVTLPNGKVVYTFKGMEE